jgi:Yip1 domain
MAMMDRIKGMLLAPKAEWPKVAAEPATVQSIYGGWVMILGLIGPVMVLLLTAMFGGLSLVLAVGQYVNTLVGVAIAALIADVIAPSFGGTRDYVASLKLVAYAATAAWIASIALIVPLLGPLVVLVGAIYSVYLLYLGVPVLKKASADKAALYTIVLVISIIVIGYLISRVLMSAGLGSMGMPTPRLGGF